MGLFVANSKKERMNQHGTKTLKLHKSLIERNQHLRLPYKRAVMPFCIQLYENRRKQNRFLAAPLIEITAH